MRVGLHARRDTHIDGLLDAQLAGDFRDAAQLDAAVDDDAAHAGLDGLAQLLRRLVVAVHEDALGREARGQRARQLAATRNVEAQALFVHDARGLLVEKRLAGVDDVGVAVAAAKCLEVGFHARAHVALVHDVERRALLARELHHVDATDEQVLVAHFGREGQHRAQLHGGAVVGLLARVCRR